MSQPAAPPCRNCGRPQEDGQLDPRGWCGDCRGVVIRRATMVGHAVAALAAAAALAVLFTVASPMPRFLMAWLVLIAALYFLLFRVARRVAFAMIRGRGVRPPEV